MTSTVPGRRSGLPAAASTLTAEIAAEPGAGLLLDITGPGGCGKTPLLEAVACRYAEAGVQVIRDLSGIEASPALAPDRSSGAGPDGVVLIDDAHQLDEDGLARLGGAGPDARPAADRGPPALAGEPRPEPTGHGPTAGVPRWCSVNLVPACGGGPGRRAARPPCPEPRPS